MPTGWAPQNPFDVLFMFGILIFNRDPVLREIVNTHQILVQKMQNQNVGPALPPPPRLRDCSKKDLKHFFPIALKKSVAFKYAFLFNVESCLFFPAISQNWNKQINR